MLVLRQFTSWLLGTPDPHASQPKQLDVKAIVSRAESLGFEVYQNSAPLPPVFEIPPPSTISTRSVLFTEFLMPQMPPPTILEIHFNIREPGMGLRLYSAHYDDQWNSTSSQSLANPEQISTTPSFVGSPIKDAVDILVECNFEIYFGLYVKDKLYQGSLIFTAGAVFNNLNDSHTFNPLKAVLNSKNGRIEWKDNQEPPQQIGVQKIIQGINHLLFSVSPKRYIPAFEAEATAHDLFPESLLRITRRANPATTGSSGE